MNIFKKIMPIGVALAFATAVIACNKPGPAETAGKNIDETAENAGQKLDQAKESFGEKTETVGEIADDSAITTKVKAAIYAEPGLRSLQFNVSTVQGEVTLSGSVDSQQNSDRAKEIAGAVAGVKDVENHLVVKSPK